MLKRIQSALFSVLEKRKFLSDEEMYKYVLMLSVTIVAGSVHIMFSIFFAVTGCQPLAVSHTVGVAIFLLACLMITQGIYDGAGIIVSIMIALSTFSTIFFIGGDNYSIFYLITVLLMLLTVPFSNRIISICGGVLMPLLMVAAHFLDALHTPIYSIGKANETLTVLNILINSFGATTMLSIDKFVRSFVDRFQKQQMQELQDQAYLDPLTGLYNRRYGDAHFENLSIRPQQGSVYMGMADIDDFKLVNDTYGHDAGDATLKLVSHIFQSNTRKTDPVFRWGGEEFLLVIHNVTEEEAFQLFEKIRHKVEETVISHEEDQFRVTITIGMGRLDTNAIPKSLDYCDQKLYEGKHSGKNVVVR
ncbi:diguanylate cyclase [Eubacteriales bacterium OttesenSCG-928-K08]|nr:diguanylate cyclase [Eubacteriales bacterium OttesenSCG-928-K08]